MKKRRCTTLDPTRGNRESQFHESTGELTSKVNYHYLSRSQWLQLPNQLGAFPPRLRPPRLHPRLASHHVPPYPEYNRTNSYPWSPFQSGEFLLLEPFIVERIPTF